ncbi:sugar ABC transporter substrate-binding protein [Nesterenkonia sp. NBAIMH1]|uniref:sugar ABC transporter substrate-binding protein n=1 Tax=Nesterenkonia sp. NBAIMH1 TaxID=2600320 RepID=UPI0011B4CA81|nr:sugar ABC transporter substrate-binding protein [Nesterenkonia sp. NBAIMH1]
MFKFPKTYFTAGSLAAISAILLTACNGDGGDAAAANEDCEETYTIGFSHPLGEVDFVNTLKSYTEEYGAETECVDVLLDGTIESNLESQRETIESWVNQGIDAIVLWPADVGAFAGLQSQAQDNGTAWLTYSSQMDGQDGSVGFDNEYSGQMIADHLDEWLDENYSDGTEDITAAIAEIPSLPPLAGRWQVPAELLEERGIEIVSLQDCGDTSCGRQVAEDVIAEHDDVRIFIGTNDDAAVGALGAFQASDIPPEETYIAGNDGIPEAFEAIESDTHYKASAAIDIEHLAHSIVDNSLAAIVGEGNPDDESPYHLVHPDDQDLLDEMKAQFE